MEYHSNSPKETENIAKAFAKELKSGDVVTLNGDLGAGKTAFAQGLAKGLAVNEIVSSPTFTIVNQYEGRLPVYHFDVYRIEDCDEMFEIGYEEMIDGDGVCVIEWAEKIAELLPVPRYDVIISKDTNRHEDFRVITITEVK